MLSKLLIEVNMDPNGVPTKRSSDGYSAKNDELKAENVCKAPANTPKPKTAITTPVQHVKRIEGTAGRMMAIYI